MGAPFRVLPGLPATGPLPEQFSDTGTGMHSEGYVVEFWPRTKESWIGNFQRGLTRYDAVAQHPNGNHVVVVAGGVAYVVDPKIRQVVKTFDGMIEYVVQTPELPLLVFTGAIWISILRPSGDIERTRRISWDGIEDIAFDGWTLTGKAYDVVNDTWEPFSVDLRDGSCRGGSYPFIDDD